MTVNYKGYEEGYKFRNAEIHFGDDEWDLMVRMEKLLTIKGWDVEIVTDGFACVAVNDYDEYKTFVKEYKEVKKMFKNCMKFGF